MVHEAESPAGPAPATQSRLSGGASTALLKASNLLVWPGLLVALAYLACLILVKPLAPDELEFFRATHFVWEGRMPYRDFWEHHTPLLWLVMSPFAVWADAARVGSFVLMRAVGSLFWIGTGAIVVAWMRRLGIRWGVVAMSLALFFGWHLFAWPLIEYRVDNPMNLLFVAGLALLEGSLRSGRPRALYLGAGGISFALACLASQRIVPMVAAALILYVLVKGDDRWGVQPAMGWAAAGGLGVALVVTGLLWQTGTLAPFWEMNVVQNALYEGSAVPSPYQPFWWYVYAFLVQAWSWCGWIMVAATAAAAAWALRGLGRPTEKVRLALLLMVQVAVLWILSSPFPYQFQTMGWLSVLLVGLGGESLASRVEGRPAVRALAGTFVALACLFTLIYTPWSVFKAVAAHQDHLLRRIERVTRPGEYVLDGNGWAFHREPVLPQWFIPRLVRVLTTEKVLKPLDVATLRRTRPAAIAMTGRVVVYLEGLDPAVARYVVTHYLPLETNLWVPAPNGLLGPETRSMEWDVLRTGDYRVVLAPQLEKGPWVESPLHFAYLESIDVMHHVFAPERFLLKPTSLSPPGQKDGLVFTLDGADLPIPPGGEVVLKAGQKLGVSDPLGRPAAVIVVPVGYPAFFEVPFPRAPVELNREVPG